MQDVDKLAGGYILVFIYVNLMLSKLNFVQQRFWLSVVGILRWGPSQDQQQLSSLELRLIYHLIKLSHMLYSKSTKKYTILFEITFSSVIMGMILGYGICSLLGLFYSAAHTVIPFILLGIGIDNIFVITQTFKTLGMYTKKCQTRWQFFRIFCKVPFVSVLQPICILHRSRILMSDGAQFYIICTSSSKWALDTFKCKLSKMLL